MSKNDGFTMEQIGLIEDLVSRRICVSKGEARRLVLCTSKDKLIEKINKTYICKKVKK